jgi:D-serine deaminase-like pyridoxal phosphate-dependent protein
MRIDDLDTPAVLIDLDVMERNLRRFQDYLNRHGIANRPHVKTHKIPALARLQLSLGAQGICCQKLGEAEVMADAGIDDIFVPYNLVGRPKLERAVALAGRIRLAVACDNADVAEGLSSAFARAGMDLPVVVECDTGMGRCGVQTPQEALELAQAVDRLPGLRFDGIMTYPPRGQIARVSEFLQGARDLLARAGLDPRVVSGGGTPDMWRAHEVSGVTEHRAGTYIFNDRASVGAGAATLEDCAMTILATVVSRPTPDRAVIDGGSKTFSSDRAGEGYGHFLEYAEAALHNFSEEHGWVDLAKCARRPRVGERVRVVPNHTCVVSNLHDRLIGVRGETVETIWDVTARGKLQ